MRATLAATSAAPLIPELELRRQAFQEAAADARGLVDGLSAAQLNWRPAPGAWSIGECLDHLRVTGEEILEEVEPAIEAARARGRTGSPPFRYGWVGRWFVRANRPLEEGARKLPAPKVFRPVAEHDPERLLAAFTGLQERLAEALARADGLDLGRVKVRSPVTPLLRISLGQWFEVVSVHQDRHLRQARAVRGRPDFPRG